MQRRDYRENREELDQEAYRDGFLSGYESGASAAIEHLSVEEFTYADYYDPSPPRSIFSRPLSESEKGGAWKVAATDLAYQIGYSDAFDRGYQDTLKTVEQAFREIRGRHL